MAVYQPLEVTSMRNQFFEDEAALQKWKPISQSADQSGDDASGNFDCNICMDNVQDPVVTFCGHLYCWPCIYKWIHFQSLSSENSECQQPQCPVCKTEISQKTIIPLYGPGQATKLSEGKAPNLGIVIPQRPPSPRCGGQRDVATTTISNMHPSQHTHHRSYPQQPQPYYSYPGSYVASPMHVGGATPANVPHPIIGMFGEMVYTTIFGNTGTALYAYPNSYHLAGSSSPRVRRHVMQTDRSLSRICFFLCCCVILCLLLF